MKLLTLKPGSQNEAVAQWCEEGMAPSAGQDLHHLQKLLGLKSLGLSIDMALVKRTSRHPLSPKIQCPWCTSSADLNVVDQPSTRWWCCWHQRLRAGQPSWCFWCLLLFYWIVQLSCHKELERVVLQAAVSLLSSAIAHPPISHPPDKEKWRPNSNFSAGEHAHSSSVSACRPKEGICIIC